MRKSLCLSYCQFIHQLSSLLELRIHDLLLSSTYRHQKQLFSQSDLRRPDALQQLCGADRLPICTDLVSAHSCHPPGPVFLLRHPHRGGIPSLQRDVLHTVFQNPWTQTSGTKVVLLGKWCVSCKPVSYMCRNTVEPWRRMFAVALCRGCTWDGWRPQGVGRGHWAQSSCRRFIPSWDPAGPSASSVVWWQRPFSSSGVFTTDSLPFPCGLETYYNNAALERQVVDFWFDSQRLFN